MLINLLVSCVNFFPKILGSKFAHIGKTTIYFSQDSKISGSQRVWQMSVKVCGQTFKADVFNPKKSEAKTDAARACLQTMGIHLDAGVGS